MQEVKLVDPQKLDQKKQQHKITESKRGDRRTVTSVPQDNKRTIKQAERASNMLLLLFNFTLVAHDCSG